MRARSIGIVCALLALPQCSRSTEGGPAGASSGAASAVAKPGVTGVLDVSGSLKGAFSWKPDLSFEMCQCFPSQNIGKLEVTMTDEKGTPIRVIAELDGSLNLGNASGAIKSGALKGKGKQGKCTSDFEKGTEMELPIDVALTGGPGEAATAKGRLVCRSLH